MNLKIEDEWKVVSLAPHPYLRQQKTRFGIQRIVDGRCEWLTQWPGGPIVAFKTREAAEARALKMVAFVAT